MNTPVNGAMVIIRVFGIISIFLGLIGLVFVGLFLFIFFAGAPDWFSQSIAPYAINSVLSAPVWIIGGVFIIAISKPLTRFVAKGCDTQ